MVNVNQIELIYRLIGKKCQIYSEQNRILFLGKIVELERDKQLRIEDCQNDDIPWRIIVSGMKIKIRINLPGDTDQFVLLSCLVTLSKNDYLTADIKAIILKDEARNHFRQTVMVKCILAKVDEPEEEHRCTVVNISARGMGLQSLEKFDNDDVLIMENSRFRKEGPVHNLKFRVIRKNRLERGFFYGCKIIDLSKIEERNLMNDIFALQTEEIRNKRKR